MPLADGGGCKTPTLSGHLSLGATSAPKSPGSLSMASVSILRGCVLWGPGRSWGGEGQVFVSSQNELGSPLVSKGLSFCGFRRPLPQVAQPPSLLGPRRLGPDDAGPPASPHPSLCSLGSKQSFWIHFSRQEEAGKTLR